MEKTMTTPKKFLIELQNSFTFSHSRKKWNSVSPPFNIWPDIDDVDKWNEQPSLKLKRLDMWKFFSKELQKNNIKTSLDIGCAGAQFTLMQRILGIEAYGVDPQTEYLFSNKPDFIKYNVDVNECLYLGDIDTLIKQFTQNPIKLDCISLLNFMHGWVGTDDECLDFLNCISQNTNFILTSIPQSEEKSREYINKITDVIIAEYNQIDVPRETHYLIKLKQ